jgi:hypothetical protein
MIQSSELILNPDGSVPPEFKTGTYTTSFSCDQNRGKITQFFGIEQREFKTQTEFKAKEEELKGRNRS